MNEYDKDLLVACQDADIQKIKTLIADGANINTMDIVHENTLMHYAVYSEDLETVNYIFFFRVFFRIYKACNI